MPKKIPPSDEQFEEEGEEEEFEDGEEGDEDPEGEEEQPVARSRGRPKKKLPPMPSPKRMPQRSQEPVEVQRRYVAFAQQAAEGIMDNETQEVIASDMWTALANIIERLERIENSIGVMQEG